MEQMQYTNLKGQAVGYHKALQNAREVERDLRREEVQIKKLQHDQKWAMLRTV